jgi:hypothetical protein
VTRLLDVERTRLALANRTEATVTRANVAAEHKSRGAIRPAFKDVGTASFLTNRVQVQSFNQAQYVVLIRRVAQPDL